MKKVLSILLATLLLISLAGCSADAPKETDALERRPDDSGRTAYEIYMLAQANEAEVSSMEMNMLIEEIFTVDGGNADNITADCNIKLVQHAEEDIEMSVDANIDIGMLGITGIRALIYYRNGYGYCDTLGQKMKMPMSLEEVMAQGAGIVDLMFSESEVTESSVWKEGDNTVLLFKLSGDESAEFMKKTVLDMGTIDSLETIGDMEIEVVIDKDMITKSIVVKFITSASVAGEPAIIDVNVKAEAVSVNDVTITPPTGLDDYMLIDIPTDGMFL